jgi:hypothetical protein
MFQFYLSPDRGIGNALGAIARPRAGIFVHKHGELVAGQDEGDALRQAFATEMMRLRRGTAG